MIRNWHHLTVKQALKTLGSTKEGISEHEARIRLSKQGPNELRREKGKPVLALLVEQFNSILIWILIFAAVVSAALGEWLDAGAIIVIVIINAILGFVQEYKAEKALEALKKLSAPKARVLRADKETVIDARNLVLGDIIVVEAGDRIPADARIINAVELRVDESALTGESTPVQKNSDVIKKEDVFIGERHNMLYSGTVCTYGHALAVVCATGMSTQMGHIARLMQETEREQTPLQKRLDVLGKQLGVIFLVLVAIIFAVGLARAQDPREMFLISVSLAVAAIPEGLPAIVTIGLALGVERMVRKKAVVRKLPAVETLGSTAVICSDKTGTLTKNEMTVRRMCCCSMSYKISGEGYSPKGAFYKGEKKIKPKTSKPLSLALEIGALCNNAALEEEKGEWRIRGDPTEAALVVAAAKAGEWQSKLSKEKPRVAEHPFDSERKMMSTLNKTKGGLVVYAKGAPEVILKRCSHAYENGKRVKLTKERKEKIMATAEVMAEEALRLIACAYKPVKKRNDFKNRSRAESNLTFVSLFGMMDPPRPEAREAVEVCKQAGMDVVMITGDHKATALAVAKELGIMKKGYLAVTGRELSKLSEGQLVRIVEKIRVYARVSPEDKQRIIHALREHDKITAMTGDGVNDAPALKLADIGVAMGITGTDVAKGASDMVLMDDNFATIVSAIEEGRLIYDNIKKTVGYLLSCNVGELLTMLIATMAGLPMPLFPLQILWMNLITDGFPAIALGVDPPTPGIMRKPPRNPHEQIITRESILKIASVGTLMALGTLTIFIFYLSGVNASVEKAVTVAFTTIIFYQLFIVFSARSDECTVLRLSPFSNPSLIYTVIISVLLQLVIIYWEPLQPIFHTVPLNWVDWVLIVGVSSSILFFTEVAKLNQRHLCKI